MRPLRAGALAAIWLIAAVIAQDASAQASVEERRSRPSASSDGERAISFLRRGDGTCRVEVTRAEAHDWHLDACVGEPDDLFFLSRSGRRFWVIRPLPRLPSREGARLGDSVVATLFDRRGRTLRRVTLRQLMPKRGQLDKVQPLGRHFKWLEGVLNAPGRGPRVTDANIVELETLARETMRLPFGG